MMARHGWLVGDRWSAAEIGRYERLRLAKLREGNGGKYGPVTAKGHKSGELPTFYELPLELEQELPNFRGALSQISVPPRNRCSENWTGRESRRVA